jgi:hypothetical protein
MALEVHDPRPMTPERRARILGTVRRAVVTYNLLPRDVAARYLRLHGLTLEDMEREAE